MPRTDRLVDLIQILSDGRLHRGRDLADTLGVSVRTIWRDMGTLMARGLSVEGERGVGYMLSAPTTLPPVALTREELEALRLGIIRLVAHLYTHRDRDDVGGVPTAVVALWRPWRRMRL